MEINLAKRLTRLSESATLKMAAATRATSAKGHNVINFTVGEPHFPIPALVQNAAIEAIHSGFSKYTPVGGIPELKEALARKLKTNGLEYTPEQILVSTGAKQSLCNFFLAAVEEGDEVLIPSPYWTSYPEIVKMAGATPVILPTKERHQFKVQAADLKKHLNSNTKVFLINSPSNPTGMIYTRDELTGLARVLEGSNILVCSDEIYEHLLLGEVPFTSFGSVSRDAFERTITVNGFSKAYAMTGWRLGYAAGPKSVISAMQMIQGQMTSGPNSVAQKAAVRALEIPLSELKQNSVELRRLGDRMRANFFASPNVSCLIPDGAFYLFINIAKNFHKSTPKGLRIDNSLDLALYLLEEAHVGTVPGSGFGADDYLRLSFATRESDIDEGCRRILRALDALK